MLFPNTGTESSIFSVLFCLEDDFQLSSNVIVDIFIWICLNLIIFLVLDLYSQPRETSMRRECIKGYYFQNLSIATVYMYPKVDIPPLCIRRN